MEQVEDLPGAEAAFGRDWTKGSTFRNLLLLAWPMVISSILNIIGPTIDMIWVGKLGSVSIAAVGVSGIVVMLAMSARWGLSAGTRAMVARFVGAGDRRGANHVAQQAFIISGIYALAVAAIGALFAEAILRLFGLEADVVAEGATYLRIMFIGAAAMSFRMMADGVMQASGDAMTPMKIAIFFRLLHVVLCPFLIFGWWIFPRLGVTGAALTNIVSQSLGMSIGLWVLFAGRSRLRLTLRNFRLDLNMIWRIVKIGIPASVNGVQWTLGSLVLVWFMIPFGTVAVAAHSLIGRVEGILFMPGMALGMAAGVLVGQNLGAGQPERAERSGWLAAGLAQGFMVVCSVAILLWAESIIGIFNTEPGLVKIASVFLRIAALGYLVMGLEAVFMMSLSGAGDTLPPMVVSVADVWLVRLPLAFLLPQVAGLGVYGVRWAIVAGMLVGAAVYTIYFGLGRWKRKMV